MVDRLNQLKAFVEKEKNTMKSFKDPKNIEKHKWYIKESLSNMKGEMLRDIDSLLQDKRVTLMRQYNNHNDSLRREISELENERKEIYNFKFNDGAIMKDNKAKVKSYLAQEFRDLKARLSKKSFKDAVDTLRVRIKAYQYGKDGEYSWYAEETNGKRATGLSTKYFKTAEEAIAAGKKEVQGYNTNSTKWVIVDEAPKSKREVWLVGLSSIKDSLTRFKDEMVVERFANNGCAVELIKTDSGKYKYRVSKGSKSKESGTVYNTILEASDEAKNTAKSFNDSAENVEDADLNELGKYISEEDLEYLKSIDFPKTHTKRAQEILNKYVKLKNNADSAINDEIVRRVDYKGCHIYIGKQGSYTYSVYTKNSMGRPLAWETGYNSEAEALEDAKKSADLIIQKFGDSAEYINDRKIDIKRDGKLIDTVNAETLDEAVRIYERQHPELKGQIDAYFSDGKVEDDTTTFEGYKIEITESNHNTYGYKIYKSGVLKVEGYGWGSRAKALETARAKIISGEIEDSKVEDGFEEEWSKLMFKMKRLQMNPNTKWSEMEALNEEMNALKKKYGKNN